MSRFAPLLPLAQAATTDTAESGGSSSLLGFLDPVVDALTRFGIGEDVVRRAVLCVAVLVLAFLANLIAKRLIVRGLERLVKRSKIKWDDAIVRRGVFKRLSHLAPAIVIHLFAPVALYGLARTVEFVQGAAVIYMIFAALLVLDAVLTVFVDIWHTLEIGQRVPIKAFMGAIRVLIFFLGAIFILAVLLDKNVSGLLAGLGALTAVLLFVFKDTILGLVAGVQIATNNMVRLGDWVEMPKYGADGDVIDISLTTVKIQNWDKTISTIPTHAFIADSFKNWRGMSESGGRRIKRSINLDMTSVKTCDAEMLGRFAKVQHIAEHIERKRREVAEHNAALSVSDDDLVNGRHLTNIGTFRAYVEAYLRSHPSINHSMTFLVRQLAPTERGLPIEIYVFSSDQRWAHYEAIQADIFDHLLAVIPMFDLRVFQAPTGADMRGLMAAAGAH